MRLFQPTYADKKSGERRTAKKWWLELTDPSNATFYLAGFNDKARTIALGRNVERLIASTLSGGDNDPDMQRFIDTLNLPALSKVRSKLIERGVLGKVSLPLHRHLLGYLRSMQGKGTTEKHSRLTIARCLRVLRGIEALCWSSVTADRVQAYLTGERTNAKRPMSTTTANHHLRACKMFSRWMHRAGRAGADVLLNVKAFKARAGERAKCERRALTVDEARRLITALADAPKSFGMSGSERALLYRLAMETGLRASELASLTRASFDLDQSPATVNVRAGCTKNRKGASLELRTVTAVLLKDHLQTKTPGAKAFNIPGVTHTADMLRADLLRAGIAFRDAADRKVDFHALRHTRGVWLAQHLDAKPAEMRELMRVSSMGLVDRYTRSLRVTRSLADIGPDLDAPTQHRATGTDSAVATLEETSKKNAPTKPEILSRILSVGPQKSVDNRGISDINASALGVSHTTTTPPQKTPQIPVNLTELANAAIMFGSSAACQSGQMERIANPLCVHNFHGIFNS